MTRHVVTTTGRVGYRTIVPYSTVDPQASLYTVGHTCPNCEANMTQDIADVHCCDCGYKEVH